MIRPCDMDAILERDIAPRTRRHEHRHDISVRAFTMIRAQIAGIRRGLIDVGLREIDLPLQLDDHDARADEQQDIGAARFHGEFVFENRGVRRG